MDTLKLTIYPKYNIIIDTTVCGSLDWDGDTYTVTGSYTKHYTIANACDSAVTMRVTVNPVPELTVSPEQAEVCEGEVVTFTPTVDNCGEREHTIEFAVIASDLA